MSTITLRSTKGSPLTNTEVDNNFSNLNTDKLESTYSGAMNSLTGGSSITTVSSTTGITTGAWKATVIAPAYGGTGVANGTNNTLTYTGNYTLGLTLSANTSVTLPTTGTLATLAGSESLTNKKLGSLTSNGFVTTSNSDGTLSVTTTVATTSGGTGLTSFTANGVVYASSTSALATGSALTYDGTTFQQSVSGLYPLISVASSGNNAILGYRINNTGTGGVDWRMEEGRSAVGEFNITNITQSNAVAFKINAIGNSSIFATSLAASQFIPSSSSIPTNGLYLPATNAIGLATNSTNALYIDSSQNVGIGTSAPDARFTVKNPNVSGAQTVMTVLGATSSVDLFTLTVNQTTDLTTIGTPSGYTAPFAIQTAGTERIRFTTSGGVSFGATGTAYGTSGQVLTSNGNAAPTWQTSSSGVTTGKAIAMAMVFGG
jgi:hypothetical protein